MRFEVNPIMSEKNADELMRAVFEKEAVGEKERGRVVGELRRGAGMAQCQLAAALGVSPQLVSSWEGGRRPVTDRSWERIRSRFGEAAVASAGKAVRADWKEREGNA